MGHKYVGLDVHQSSTVAAVHDEQGKSDGYARNALIECIPVPRP
jgi:hypothetical protein